MLRLEGVSVSIGAVAILRGVDLDVNSGEFVGLIGRNGAGKTTLLRTIMGLLTPASGRLDFESAALAAMPTHRRAGLGIGYMPEDRRLVPGFTVEENILLPARVAKLDGAETKRRLDRAYTVLPELATLKGRPAGSLSGGQGKMAALGRALMLGTKLVILDEPFQGLAPVLAQRYAEALRRLRAQDTDITLLITESNPKLLETFADTTITIERGEIEVASQAA